MNLLRLLFFAIVGWLGWRSVRRVQASANDRERALNIRGTIALWILGAIFVAAIFAVPGRGRIFLMIPLVLVMGAAFKAYRNSRRAIRDAADLEAKLERMKRVH